MTSKSDDCDQSVTTTVKTSKLLWVFYLLDEYINWSILREEYFEEDEKVIPKPFFLNIEITEITAQDLTDEFGAAVEYFYHKVKMSSK